MVTKFFCFGVFFFAKEIKSSMYSEAGKFYSPVDLPTLQMYMGKKKDVKELFHIYLLRTTISMVWNLN